MVDGPPRTTGGALGAHLGVVLTVAAVTVVLCGGAARGGADPEREWFTLRTAHFAVHSYDPAGGGEAFARRAAAFLEEAYTQVNELLGWTPQERVQVSIVDDVDSANGFAAVMPYNHITLLAFPPSASGNLGDYDDWLRLLVFHEYAHVAHLDNATGVPEVVNTVLGKTLKPNQGLPRWLTEGLATWVESRTSGAGRVSASLFQMFSRTAALQQTLPKLGQLSGPPLFEPGGSSWYLYGGYLFDTIAKAAGGAAVKKWAYTYGRRLIPYSINHTMKAATGKGLDHWYQAMLAGVNTRAAAVKARVLREGRVLGRQVTVGGEYKSPPAVSRDGRWLLYARHNGRGSVYLGRAPIDDPGAFQPLIKCDAGCGDPEPAMDGRSVWTHATRFFRRVNSYSDIVRFQLRPGQRGRDGAALTRGARAQHPRLSADGKRLWVIKSSWGRTWLEALHPLSGATLYRWDPPPWARLEAPAPGRDGEVVYLSLHHQGNRDIYALELGSRTLRRLTYGRSLEVDLRVGPSGRYLFYASDADGVFNIYARDLSSHGTFKLTNVFGGAFGPSPSADGGTLFYRGWTAAGWELYALALDVPGASRVAVPDPKPPREERAVATVTAERQAYSPLPTMLPRSWLPTWVADSTGLSKLGLVLGGQDVTERFGTTVALEYDLGRQDVSFYLDLDLRLWWPDLSLKLGRYSWDGSMTMGDVTDDYRGEVYYGRVDVGLPLPSIMTPMRFDTGFAVDFSRGVNVPDLKHTPDESYPSIPREGVSTAWSMALSWADAEQPKWAITPVRGGSGAFAVLLRHPAIGSHGDAFRFTYRLKRYIQMPFHLEHVLMLAASGGWSTGSNFSIGGVPPQDVLVDLVNERQGNSTYLRGFEADAFQGRAYHLVTTEYRFPILRARTGIESLPIFFKDLHAAVFADVGVAYNEPFLEDDLGRIRGSVGLELRLDVELLFGFSANLRLGYAHGFGEDGRDHVYFMVAPPP